MSTATRTTTSRSVSAYARRWRGVLLGIAVVRVVAGIVAIPLAPVLYERYYLWLVLLRPTKEVMLFGGFLARRGDTNLLHLIVAAIPLAILGVWLFYALGAAYSKEIRSGKLPGIGSRILPVKKIKKMDKVLKKHGAKVVFIGRLAVFPSAAVAAAAGTSRMEPKSFFVADLVGGLLSIAEVIGAGWLFGAAYEEAGPWITGVGVAALLGVLFVVGRALTRD